MTKVCTLIQVIRVARFFGMGDLEKRVAEKGEFRDEC